MRWLLTWMAPILLGAGVGQAELAYYQPPPPPPPPPVADRAGNWRIHLNFASSNPDGSERACTPDGRLCASLRRAQSLALEIAENGSAARPVASWPRPEGRVDFGIDSVIVREADGTWLIGVQRDRYVEGPREYRYDHALSLYHLAPGAAAANLVLDLPLFGERTLHLCPPRRSDRQTNRPPPPKCTRDYRLEALFDLDLENPAGPPRFILTTHTGIFPAPPALAAGPDVTPALTRDTAPLCSYRRMFTFDPSTGRYVPDSPLPACPDFQQF